MAQRADDTNNDGANAADEVTIEQVGQLIDEILDERSSLRNTFLPGRLHKLRSALDKATRICAWDVLDLTFALIAATSTEMMVRAVVALRTRCDMHDQKPKDLYPPVAEHAERLQRVANFTLDCATRYAKVRHLTTIAKRGDPKIVSIDDARKKADTTKGRRNATRKSKEAVEA
jgi:hypothetical protein